MLHQRIGRQLDPKVAAAAYEAVEDDAILLARKSDRLRAGGFPSPAAEAFVAGEVHDLRERIADAGSLRGHNEDDFLEAVRQGLENASGGRRVKFETGSRRVVPVVEAFDAEAARLRDDARECVLDLFQIDELLDTARARRETLERGSGAAVDTALSNLRAKIEKLETRRENAVAAVEIAERAIADYSASKVVA